MKVVGSPGNVNRLVDGHGLHSSVTCEPAVAALNAATMMRGLL